MTEIFRYLTFFIRNFVRNWKFSFMTINDFQSGATIIIDGQPYEVIEISHSKTAQAQHVAQTKLRNLITGAVLSRNFKQSETFEEAEIEYLNVKFLYAHRGDFWFCEENNPKNRFSLSEKVIGEQTKYLKPNTIVKAARFEGKIINVELPIKMDFKVAEAPPAIRGNTAQGGTKIIKLETDAEITAPLFINEGDIVRVNTRTGQYSERVKKGEQ